MSTTTKVLVILFFLLFAIAWLAVGIFSLVIGITHVANDGVTALAVTQIVLGALMILGSIQSGRR